MKLLITGGCGFVGHHLVEEVLKETNWKIILLDRLSYAGNLNKIADISVWEKKKDRIRFVFHDLRAPISGTTAHLIGNIDYIWHLAAESHVDRSLNDSIPFVMSNVLGTANLLEYVKAHQPTLKKFIHFSTDEVYGPAPEGIFWKEWDRLKPSNPYAAAKAGSDCLAYAFAHSFGLPIVITRSMNIFGERQNPEKFIPKTIRAVLNNEKITIHGTLGNISSRCWIHARRVGEAITFLTREGKPEEIYHIVGEERSVLDLANGISKIIRGRDLKEGEIEYIDFHKTRPGHDLRYALDGTKLGEMDWYSRLSLDDSFDKMVRWMIKKENRKWLDI